jgi:hypothetical protein
MRLKAWDAEKQRYEFKQLRAPNAPGGGAFAYSLKPDVILAEPPYSICPNCYADGHKSVLQGVTQAHGRVNLLSCHRCGLQLNLTGIEY